MTNFLKLASVSVLALALTACGAEDSKMADKVAETTVAAEADMKAAAAKAEAEMKQAAAKAKAEADKLQASMNVNVMVGGAAMSPTKTIVENARQADNLKTLVALVKQAQLADTLSRPGPYTVFAPTDAAFKAVPKETTAALMKDENRKTLQGILTYHVVAGKMTASDLVKQIEKNGGSYTAETVAGGDLKFRLDGSKVKITDGKGGVSTVTIADVMQSNGVVHVVDTVLMPK
ncbi:hypothetical protein GCM10011309_27020 [Litorimonas cladophorae]|uniref:FAS1 domain-containing protein n=1 Tax=Litorimonas cladophorae TaxID=1220491 RepID=A0A918NKK7_9PROT|nr:fasciclin domain-containing protein [Litorimonas cladophorae]GGX75394.1 hypothetical protein GCM10011309_27020 [Litorimonas cladophorae]